MALDMMAVRTRPDAPTSAPEMIRAWDPITKPVEAAASPDIEFRKATITGMSAPPIGSVRVTPSRPARATSNQRTVRSPEATIHTPGADNPAARTESKTNCPLNSMGRPAIRPCSFPNATKLPVNVARPTTVRQADR